MTEWFAQPDGEEAHCLGLQVWVAGVGSEGSALELRARIVPGALEAVSGSVVGESLRVLASLLPNTPAKRQIIAIANQLDPDVPYDDDLHNPGAVAQSVSGDMPVADAVRSSHSPIREEQSRYPVCPICGDEARNAWQCPRGHKFGRD